MGVRVWLRLAHTRYLLLEAQDRLRRDGELVRHDRKQTPPQNPNKFFIFFVVIPHYHEVEDRLPVHETTVRVRRRATMELSQRKSAEVARFV